MNDEMLQAFNDASGLNAGAISLFFALITVGGFYLWGAWVIMGHWKLYASGALKIGDLFTSTLRTLLLLVFVSIFFYVQG